MSMQHISEILKPAVEKYSEAMKRRLAAKQALYYAQAEDQASRFALTDAKEELRNLEAELSEGVYSPDLVLSRVKIKGKQTVAGE